MAVWTVYLSLCLLMALSASVEAKPVQNRRSVGSKDWPGTDKFFTTTGYKTWSDSRQFCRDNGGDLVIIKSEKKQRLVSAFVKLRIDGPVWIGLTDTESEGKMKWVDNSPLKRGFWMKGEPNNIGNEDCVKMNLRPDLFNWNDIPCSEYSKVLCE